jgi:hypothetical protein
VYASQTLRSVCDWLCFSCHDFGSGLQQAQLIGNGGAVPAEGSELSASERKYGIAPVACAYTDILTFKFESVIGIEEHHVRPSRTHHPEASAHYGIHQERCSFGRLQWRILAAQNHMA